MTPAPAAERPGRVARDDPQRVAFARRVAELIDAAGTGRCDDASRDTLLDELCAWQAEHVAPYARLVAAHRRRTTAHAQSATLRWPATPTDVFRSVRVASYDSSEDVRVFRTSGTTSGERGVHAFRDLALYDRAARAAADVALFPDLASAHHTGERRTMRLVVLAPSEGEAPDSSLSYMLARFVEWYATSGDGDVTHVFSRDAIDANALRDALERAQRDGTPVGLLGTSFAFVFADEALGAQRFRLPAGSRIMQTGGFKGRTRELAPAQMRALLAARYAVPESHILAEYGMTELSSQLYETTLADALRGAQALPRTLWVPPWVRATLVNPETLAPVGLGEVGALRLDDPANLDSVCAIQTADLARREASGLVLLGRATGAVPRGCSLAIEEALTRSGRADE